MRNKRVSRGREGEDAPWNAPCRTFIPFPKDILNAHLRNRSDSVLGLFGLFVGFGRFEYFSRGHSLGSLDCFENL